MGFGFKLEWAGSLEAVTGFWVDPRFSGNWISMDGILAMDLGFEQDGFVTSGCSDNGMEMIIALLMMDLRL